MLIKKKRNVDPNEQKSMSFVESPTAEYLEKLVQLYSSMNKNKKLKQSEE